MIVATRVPLKRIFQIVNGSTPKSDNAACWDGDIVWATPEDVSSAEADGKIQSSARGITQSGYDSCGTSLVPKGSIVLTTRAPIGNVAVAEVPLCTNQGCKSLVPHRRTTNTRFFYYQFKAIAGYLNALGNGATFAELASRELAKVDLIAPLFPEQHAVAVFLDRETAKADALIAKYERLIELLEEKRIALITQVVTKGLDPSVPTKDSGVAWIGRVPAAWSMWKMGRVFQEMGSGTTPPTSEQQWYDGDVPFVTTSELREVVIDATQKTLTEEAVRKFSALKIYPVGAVVIAMYGATVGRLGILGQPSSVNQACCVLRASGVVLGRYAFYFLMGFRSEIVALSLGGGQPNISQQIIRALKIPVPPKGDQERIVAYLDSETRKLDALKQKVEQAISLSKEHRSVLITAAVTGQIDVRTYKGAEVSA